MILQVAVKERTTQLFSVTYCYSFWLESNKFATTIAATRTKDFQTRIAPEMTQGAYASQIPFANCHDQWNIIGTITAKKTAPCIEAKIKMSCDKKNKSCSKRSNFAGQDLYSTHVSWDLREIRLWKAGVQFGCVKISINSYWTDFQSNECCKFSISYWSSFGERNRLIA